GVVTGQPECAITSLPPGQIPSTVPAIPLGPERHQHHFGVQEGRERLTAEQVEELKRWPSARRGGLRQLPFSGQLLQREEFDCAGRFAAVFEVATAAAGNR